MSSTMEVGKHYVVTKRSDNGAFEVSDHLLLNADGSISCLEAQGWIETSDVTQATHGMEVSIDQAWLAQRRAKLDAELAALGA